jgi:hypothetical protein
MSRRRKFKGAKRGGVKYSSILDELDQKQSEEYSEGVASLTESAILESATDKEDISRVLDWMMNDSGSMDDDLASHFEKILNNYRTKIRILHYAITRERLSIINDAIKAEKELIKSVMNGAVYVSNESKIKLLQSLSEMITGGMENVNELAGLTDTPEDILSSLQGQLKKDARSAEFSKLAPEDREKLRQELHRLLTKEPVRVVTNEESDEPNP